MFERVVSYFLQKYLGWLVKGLDAEALNVSIWGGDIVLNNLELQENALTGSMPNTDKIEVSVLGRWDVTVIGQPQPAHQALAVIGLDGEVAVATPVA